MAKPALGRGLGALLGGSPAKSSTAAPAANIPADEQARSGSGPRIQRVALDQIVACPFQPRREFTPEALQELADSIREQGIMQPLVAREREGRLELIAGERRWRAARLAGLTEAPVVIRQADDRAVLELALIENLQRENLNPLEEARGYAQLNEQFHLTQEEVATRVGKSRATVANALRLLKLPAEVQGHLREERLSVGHAKVLLGLSTERQQRLAAERVVREGLNVRQTELLVARARDRENQTPKAGAAEAAPGDPHVASLENRLRERLGTKIRLRYAQGKGALEINFFSDAELERILQILGVEPE